MIKCKCQDPFQQLALMHIQQNFYDEGISQLELIKDGIRLTDKNGAIADFVYNGVSGSIEMQEVDSSQLRREKERKEAVELIKRNLQKC